MIIMKSLELPNNIILKHRDQLLVSSLNQKIIFDILNSNQNLNIIIGGKRTGKSIFMHDLNETLQSSIFTPTQSIIVNPDDFIAFSDVDKDKKNEYIELVLIEKLVHLLIQLSKNNLNPNNKINFLLSKIRINLNKLEFSRKTTQFESINLNEIIKMVKETINISEIMLIIDDFDLILSPIQKRIVNFFQNFNRVVIAINKNSYYQNIDICGKKDYYSYEIDYKNYPNLISEMLHRRRNFENEIFNKQFGIDFISEATLLKIINKNNLNNIINSTDGDLNLMFNLISRYLTIHNNKSKKTLDELSIQQIENELNLINNSKETSKQKRKIYAL